mgnify:FL=1
MKKIFRVIKLQKYRITKIKDFPESVAVGIAWGAAVSFTPLLGFHLIICYLGTWLMRGNLIAATVGTIIGNPWTFPFIFYLDYQIGTTIFYDSIDYYEFKISFLVKNFEDLFYPTLWGSLPLAIFIWFVTFNICKNFLIKRIHEKNKIRR